MFFEYPKLLWLMVVPVLMALHYIWIELSGRRPHLRVSTSVPWMQVRLSFMSLLRHVPFLLRVFALVMIIIAIARPRSSQEMERVDTEGIDIILAMDVSTSMLARDLVPDRISASKDIAIEFISQRPSDRMGIVVFAGESFTQCPLTVDHSVLLNLFHSIKGDIAQRGLIEDGTAIGMGIANAVSRLKDSKAKSKVIILLTDGTNNRGDISPLMAAEIAKSFGIRVYTVAVGTNGTAPYPMVVGGVREYVNVPVEIDTEILSQIAEKTDGRTYRATNTEKLFEVYEEIDKLERTKMNVKKYSKRYEAYQPFAIVAFIALLLALVLKATVLKRLP